MQSTAKDVTTYLQEVPENRRACLTKIRDLCVRTLKGYEESMDYGGPCYKKNGVAEVGFASQKNYIALYILKEDVIKANRELLQGLSVGKGCIRYPKPDKVDLGVVKKLLVGTVKSKAPVC